jgi:heme/copper-type cytochrome/quinol oxidase subunit 2
MVGNLLRTGLSGLILLVIMLGGGIALWIGVPVGWLYVGSQVEGKTHSLGTAILVMMLGAVISILVIVPMLGWLNQKHLELREARGLETHGGTALEAVMTISAGIALLAFGAWFLLFSGASPLPVGLRF